MMHVQNYVGSTPQADTRFVCVIHTTLGQYFNRHSASCRFLCASRCFVSSM